MTDMGRDSFEDDGRTICPMDVDGMPDSPFSLSGKREKLPGKAQQRTRPVDDDSITPSEARRYSWYAVLAGLTVAGVVGGGTVLFIFILWIMWR